MEDGTINLLRTRQRGQVLEVLWRSSGAPGGKGLGALLLLLPDERQERMQAMIISNFTTLLRGIWDIVLWWSSGALGVLYWVYREYYFSHCFSRKPPSPVESCQSTIFFFWPDECMENRTKAPTETEHMITIRQQPICRWDLKANGAAFLGVRLIVFVTPLNNQDRYVKQNNQNNNQRPQTHQRQKLNISLSRPRQQ